MKVLVLYSFVLLFFSCSEVPVKNKTKDVPAIKEGQFDWLLGSWERTNEKKDRRTYEYWNKKSNIEYIGLGFTLQNQDTIWREKMRLIKSNEHWNFEVKIEDDTLSTNFKLTDIEDDNFTCKNAVNEFPKKIHYFKAGDKVKAIISGGDMSIPFEFTRI